MSNLVPALELGTYNQGELGVYGRPMSEYVEDRDNPFKAFLDKGRHDITYFDRFETVDELIQTIKENIDKLDMGLLTNLSIPPRHLYDRKLEFLEDTLMFLITGTRRVALEQWMVLIDDGSKYLTHRQRDDLLYRIERLREQIARTPHPSRQYSELSTYISMWCEKARGVRDMAYSLYFYSLIPQVANS